MPWPKDHIKKDHPLTIRLSSSQVEDLEQLSGELTVRQYISKIIGDHLKKMKDTKKSPPSRTSR